MPARALPPPQPDAMAELAELVLSMQPDELELFARQLPAGDLQLLEYVLAEHHAMGWRRDPASFAHHLDRTFKVWRYVQLLADAFVAAIDGSRPRQLWSLPGRYGKTLLLQWGLTWAIDRTPSARSIFVSYGDDLALETGAEVRDRLARYREQLRTELRRDRKARDRWLTPEGGGLLAAGLRTGITGYGASKGGALVVDDPFKGWTEAHRQTDRDDVADRFKGTLRNRLDDEDAGIIVVHHRLHQDDLIGRLHGEAEDGTGEPWELIALPAIAPDPAVAVKAGKRPKPDPLGRKPGEVIEPERFTIEQVRSRHRGMGSSYLVAALEQQDPQPPEGKELLREWFILVESAELPRQAELAITSWDTKLKDREAGDYVVGQCWWRVAGGYFLMDQLRGQYDHATTANAIALMQVRHPEVRTHYVEAAGSAPEVLAELRKAQEGYVVSDTMAQRLAMTPAEREAVQALRRRGMPGLQTNPAKGDKAVRARAYIAPNAEPGHVRMPADAAWVPTLLDEVAEFPDGLHDDQVDAMSQALQKLARGGATATAPSGQVGRPAPGAHRTSAPAVAPTGRRASVQAPRGPLPRRRR
jgi:predicted phage terminase large subunit-like protein